MRARQSRRPPPPYARPRARRICMRRRPRSGAPNRISKRENTSARVSRRKRPNAMPRRHSRSPIVVTVRPAPRRISDSERAVSEAARRFRVTGKVQGVFFRHSTRLEAERLALLGYARNLPDGSVEVAVRGAAAAVEQLHRWLHRGPKSARVAAVQEMELALDEAGPANEGFEVL